MRYLPTDLGEPSEAKKALRRDLRKKRRAIDPTQKTELDSVLVLHTLQTKEFRKSKLLLLYAPLSDEPNLLPLAEEAFRAGKQVAFPISHTESHTLSFHTVTSLSELCEGTYGIFEPPVSAPQITDTKNALCIVPALAFDQGGFRLGYGGGYYDRFLSEFQGTAIGLCYHELLQHQLPRGSYDRAVDLLITEKGVLLPDEIQKTEYSSR